jgi:hypothetical protein
VSFASCSPAAPCLYRYVGLRFRCASFSARISLPATRSPGAGWDQAFAGVAPLLRVGALTDD